MFTSIWKLTFLVLTLEIKSILKEINPEYSLEGLMLKLKLQYFGHLMQRTNSSEKTLMLGKTQGSRRRGGQRRRWLGGITDVTDVECEQAPGADREAWRAAVHEAAESRARLSDWTELILMISQYFETFYILHCLLTKINKMSMGKCLPSKWSSPISVLEKKEKNNHLILSTLFFMHFPTTIGSFLCVRYCARCWGYKGE